MKERLWEALVALAPPGTPRTWQALARAAPGGLDPLLVERLSVSPPEAAEVPEPLLSSATARLSALADVDRQRRSDAIIRRQGGAIAAIIVGLWLASTGVLAATRLFEPVDLAKDKPWRASSSWGSCDPVHGVCGALRSRIFFHTLQDDSPWVEIDLGKPTRFSSMTIVNRHDEHLEERAVPLVLEVSDDQQSWKEVARRDDSFSTWSPRFEPVTARFVRARVARKSWLHLEAVKVHP